MTADMRKWRIYSWYDRLEEPWHFLLVFIIASPIITSGIWADTPGKWLAAGLYFAAILLPRAYYVSRK